MEFLLDLDLDLDILYAGFFSRWKIFAVFAVEKKSAKIIIREIREKFDYLRKFLKMLKSVRITNSRHTTYRVYCTKKKANTPILEVQYINFESSCRVNAT